MPKFFLTVIFIYCCHSISAQDTLLLITGRKMIVSNVSLQDNNIAYRTLVPGSKVKTIEPDRVFSIIYKDGREQLIYQPDSLDPIDFKVEEMRNFIHGEQDARELYKNDFIKVLGFGIGAGSGFLAFYGLVGPPIYSTVIGSFSPNVEKRLSFNVSGNAIDQLGISSGKYLNEVTGKSHLPVIKKDQKLKIANKTFRFKQDMTLDSAVAFINTGFKCMRVHAANDNGNIKLYKANSTARISENPYREGFEKKVRDFKIRNAMICGLIGFVVGSAAYITLLK